LNVVHLVQVKRTPFEASSQETCPPMAAQKMRFLVTEPGYSQVVMVLSVQPKEAVVFPKLEQHNDPAEFVKVPLKVLVHSFWIFEKRWHFGLW